MNGQTIIDALNRRYAVSKFDTEKKIDHETMATLLESLRLSPSSFGLQGRGFVLVTNQDTKVDLLPHAFGQQKVIDAPYLLVLCRRTDVDGEFVSKYMSSIAEQRNMPIEALDGFKGVLQGVVQARSEDELKAWLIKQVYISLGFFLETAALLNVDAAPMEGFDPTKFDEILGLKEHNLASCVIVAFGHRSPDDQSASRPKVRWNLDQVLIRK